MRILTPRLGRVVNNGRISDFVTAYLDARNARRKPAAFTRLKGKDTLTQLMTRYAGRYFARLLSVSCYVTIEVGAGGILDRIMVLCQRWPGWIRNGSTMGTEERAVISFQRWALILWWRIIQSSQLLMFIERWLTLVNRKIPFFSRISRL